MGALLPLIKVSAPSPLYWTLGCVNKIQLSGVAPFSNSENLTTSLTNQPSFTATVLTSIDPEMVNGLEYNVP